MGDQVAIDVELGHHGRGRTTVGVKAKLEAGVVIGTYKYYACAYLVVNGNALLATRSDVAFDGGKRQLDVWSAQDVPE